MSFYNLKDFLSKGTYTIAIVFIDVAHQKFGELVDIFFTAPMFQILILDKKLFCLKFDKLLFTRGKSVCKLLYPTDREITAPLF